MKTNDFTDELSTFMKILDENIDLLSDIEENLDNDKENECTTNMELHQLLDMVEDVAESSKIKRAQTRFNQRQTQDSA